MASDTEQPPAPHDQSVRPVAASDLVAACEAAWRAIQQRHAELPDTVVVLGSGVERGRLVKLGHWWGAQWRVGDQARGEVLLAGEALHLAPEAVFEVLLHEAAHGLNAARGVRDASRGGRYHNQRYRAAAAEVGLRPRRLDPYGWARTELTPAAASHYRDCIERIGSEMRLARGLPGHGADGDGGPPGPGGGASEGEGEREGEREQRAKPRAAECGCAPARKLRMAPSVLALGPVVCGLCGEGFDVRGVELRPPGRSRFASAALDASPADLAAPAEAVLDLRTVGLPALGGTAAVEPEVARSAVTGPSRAIKHRLPEPSP